MNNKTNFEEATEKQGNKITDLIKNMNIFYILFIKDYSLIIYKA